MKNKKVCTILPFYNGSNFIEEQINSILNQIGIIERYETEIIIYNDGSSESETEFIHKKYDFYSNIKIISNKNIGIYKTFMFGFLDNILQYDFLFFSDQDDVFLNTKYSAHIERHLTSNKGLVMSGLQQWDGNIKQEPSFYDTAGHVMSFSNDYIFTKQRVNTLRKFIISNNSKALEARFHDDLLAKVYIALDSYSFIKEVHGLHRTHVESVTTPINKLPDQYLRKLWADDYGHYKEIKSVLRDVFDCDLKINEYNKMFYIMEGSSKPSYIKWKLDNLAMYLHAKFLRNLVENIVLKTWKK